MIAKVYTGFVLLLLTLLAGVLLASKVASAQSTQSVIISEYMVDPTITTDAKGEWIEIVNKTSAPVDITNWDIDGSTIIGGEVIQPDQYFVVCKNIDEAQNGGVVCDGSSGFSLSNTSDTINLRDQNNSVVATVSYAVDEVNAGKSNALNQLNVFATTNTVQYGLGDFGSPAKNSYGHILTHAILEKNSNRWPDLFAGETYTKDVKYDLYKIVDGQWQGYNSALTGAGNFPLASWLSVPAGKYAVCLDLSNEQFATFAYSMESLFSYKQIATLNLADGADMNVGTCGEFDVTNNLFSHIYLGFKQRIGTTSSIQVKTVIDADENEKFSKFDTAISRNIKVYAKDNWQDQSSALYSLDTKSDGSYLQIDLAQSTDQVVVCVDVGQDASFAYSQLITSFASAKDVRPDNSVCALVQLIIGEKQTLVFGLNLL